MVRTSDPKRDALVLARWNEGATLEEIGRQIGVSRQTVWEMLRRLGAPRRRAEPIQGCSVPGCPREHAARGYCRMHLLRFYRNGEPGPAEPHPKRR